MLTISTIATLLAAAAAVLAGFAQFERGLLKALAGAKALGCVFKKSISVMKLDGWSPRGALFKKSENHVWADD